MADGDTTLSASDVAESQASETSDSTRQSSGDYNPQDFVTPDLQDKFNEVFGDGEDGGRKPANPPSRREKSNLTRDRLARQNRGSDQDEDPDTTADGTEEATEEDGETPPGRQQQPASQQGQAQEGDEPTLSPVLRQAAKRAGWKDDQIVKLWENDPELATTTFSNLLATHNELSTRFGQLGQLGQQQQQPQYQQPNPQQQWQQQQQYQQPPQQLPQQGEDVLAGIFGPDYADRFAPRYGDTFAQDVLQPLMQTLIAPVQQLWQRAQLAEQESMTREIDAFFKTQEEAFGDLYGKGASRSISRESFDNRMRVLQQADAIRNGATRAGQSMSVADSIEAAHLLVNADQIQTVARKQVTQQVQKRASRITARPTQRRQMSAREAGTKSDTAAAEAFASRAAEIPGWNEQ
jgi:hypothetical protein